MNSDPSHPALMRKLASEASAAITPSGLCVRQISAGFGATQILKDVSLNVATGNTLVVLGESGCGKTTLLRAIAGLIPISSGEVELRSRMISLLPPYDREVLYLDQEPLLFEHLSVFENIAFPLRMKKAPEQTIQSAVRELLVATDLLPHAAKREGQLSGGQKQRVAFGRAILARPQLLLLDEPFCSLDSRTRSHMQSLFAELSQRYSLTSIFVTHDVREALVVGHQFGRMADGVLSVYHDRQSFISDDATGIPAEIAFWKRL